METAINWITVKLTNITLRGRNNQNTTTYLWKDHFNNEINLENIKDYISKWRAQIKINNNTIIEYTNS